MSTEAWLIEILKAVASVKGMSTAAIAVLVVQILMKFFETPLSQFAGKWKLLAVSGLTVVASVLSGLAMELPLSAALGQAPVLAAVQVFVHQIWVHAFQTPVPVNLIDKKA